MEKNKIGFYNHKGGCAKTTSVINITYALQKLGKSVLVVDCDSQMNCFSFFQSGKELTRIQQSRYEGVFITTWDNYKETDGNMDYDYILFDLPPALTDEVKEIIKHCDIIFVPIVLGYYEIAGFSDVTDEIQKQGTKLGGVFVNRYNLANDDDKVVEELREIWKKRLLNALIPESKTVRESQKAEITIEEYFVKSKVPPNPSSWKIVHAFKALANEIIERSENQ